MTEKYQVAVCSRSFSKNPVLRKELEALYESVRFNDLGLNLVGDALIDFVGESQKIIVGLETVDSAMLAKLPQLKVVSKYGVGLDKINLESLKQFDVALGWTPGVNRRSVTELVLSAMISLLRHVPQASRLARTGGWAQHIGGQLSGRTVGVIGCGHVGKDLVELLEPFGCRILVNDIVHDREFYSRYKIEDVDLESLLRQSDIVTLHVPLDSSTRGMLDKERLSLMQPSAMLINAARGGLLDETALGEMLKSGRLAAAALDVFEVEPPQDAALLALPNLLVTPHLGGSAEEAILAMGRAAIEGLDQNSIP